MGINHNERAVTIKYRLRQQFGIPKVDIISKKKLLNRNKFQGNQFERDRDAILVPRDTVLVPNGKNAIKYATNDNICKTPKTMLRIVDLILMVAMIVANRVTKYDSVIGNLSIVVNCRK